MSPPQDTPGLFRHTAAVPPDPKRHGAGDDRGDAPAPDNPSPTAGSDCVAAPSGRISSEEEEEIAYALRLSLGAAVPEPPKNKSPMTTSSNSISISCYDCLPPKKRKVKFGVDLGINGGDVAHVVDPALRRELDMGLIKFGKAIVTEEFAAILEPPPKRKEKLMSAAIRAAAATPRSSPPMTIIIKPPPPNTKNKTTMTTMSTSTSNGTSNSHADHRFKNLPNCSARLRRRLMELDATALEFVCEKLLKRSDVHLNQNRLLISCKRDQLAGSPITRLFTGAEMASVQEQDEEEDKRKRREEKPKRGLRVKMLDAGGGEYAMLCRYLNSNGGYRFIEEWGKFLKDNGMSISKGDDWSRNVVVRLLAFRSRRLPRAELSGHRDGALGFVVLHEEFDGGGGGGNDDGDGNGGDDDEEEYMVNARAKPKKKKKNDRKKEADVKAASTSRSAAAGASSSSAAADVAARSLEEEGMLIFWAIQGMAKLMQDPESSSSSSSSSPECDGSKSKPSSDKQDKAYD